MRASLTPYIRSIDGVFQSVGSKRTIPDEFSEILSDCVQTTKKKKLMNLKISQDSEKSTAYITPKSSCQNLITFDKCIGPKFQSFLRDGSSSSFFQAVISPSSNRLKKSRLPRNDSLKENVHPNNNSMQSESSASRDSYFCGSINELFDEEDSKLFQDIILADSDTELPKSSFRDVPLIIPTPPSVNTLEEDAVGQQKALCPSPIHPPTNSFIFIPIQTWHMPTERNQRPSLTAEKMTLNPFSHLKKVEMKPVTAHSNIAESWKDATSLSRGIFDDPLNEYYEKKILDQFEDSRSSWLSVPSTTTSSSSSSSAHNNNISVHTTPPSRPHIQVKKRNNKNLDDRNNITATMNKIVRSLQSDNPLLQKIVKDWCVLPTASPGRRTVSGSSFVTLLKATKIFEDKAFYYLEYWRKLLYETAVVKAPSSSFLQAYVSDEEEEQVEYENEIENENEKTNSQKSQQSMKDGGKSTITYNPPPPPPTVSLFAQVIKHSNSAASTNTSNKPQHGIHYFEKQNPNHTPITLSTLYHQSYHEIERCMQYCLANMLSLYATTSYATTTTSSSSSTADMMITTTAKNQQPKKSQLPITAYRMFSWMVYTVIAYEQTMSWTLSPYTTTTTTTAMSANRDEEEDNRTSPMEGICVSFEDWLAYMHTRILDKPMLKESILHTIFPHIQLPYTNINTTQYPPHPLIEEFTAQRRHHPTTTTTTTFLTIPRLLFLHNLTILIASKILPDRNRSMIHDILLVLYLAYQGGDTVYGGGGDEVDTPSENDWLHPKLSTVLKTMIQYAYP